LLNPHHVGRMACGAEQVGHLYHGQPCLAPPNALVACWRIKKRQAVRCGGPFMADKGRCAKPGCCWPNPNATPSASNRSLDGACARTACLVLCRERRSMILLIAQRGSFSRRCEASLLGDGCACGLQIGSLRVKSGSVGEPCQLESFCMAPLFVSRGE
jgi:hypothetical protein